VSARRVGFIVALATLIALAAALTGRRTRARPSALATERPVGPIAHEPPPGATIARDEGHLQQLIADGPAEIWLDAKTYHTELLVRRTVAIHGRNGAALEGPHRGTVVSIIANDVVLDNIAVRGSGSAVVGEDTGVRMRGERNILRHALVEDTLFGVTLEQCTFCVIEDSHVRGRDIFIVYRGDGIKLWESHDTVVRRNLVERVRDIVVWYSRRTLCEDNIVRDSRYGTHYMYSHDSTVRRSRLVDNVVGVFVMYSARLTVEHNLLAGARGGAGMGVGFKESDGVAVHDNTIAANTVGLFLDRSPLDPAQHVTIRDNDILLNQIGIRLHGDNLGVSFLENDIMNNASLVDIESGGDATKLEFDRNHFSEYAGYDLNGDGLGDIPFTFERLSSELAYDHPQIEFMHGTVAMTLVDVVSRAFPLLAPRVILVDKRPSMRPLRSTP